MSRRIAYWRPIVVDEYDVILSLSQTPAGVGSVLKRWQQSERLEYDERCPGIAYTTLSCMQCGMTQCGPFVRVKWPLHGIQVRAVSESGPEGGGTD